MKHVHVCLVSDQPIPNLITVQQFQPDSVILLTTRDKKIQAERLAGIIEKKNVDVSTREIMPYDIDSVITVSESIIKKCSDCEVSLNITGGTKIGTLGTFQAFYSMNKPIFYVNTRDNEILKVSPQEDRITIKTSITIKDYLTVYGFNPYGYLKDDSFIYKRKEITNALAQIAVKNPKLIGALNSILPSKPENESYPLKVRLPGSPDMKNISQMIDSLGLAEECERAALKFRGPETVKYLKGFWFEEYVYMIAKSLDVYEVRINVEGKWDTAGKIHVKNEFDVLIANKNRLFYISCKTSNPDRKIDERDESVTKEYLYELDSIRDTALGLFGKPMLASAREIHNKYVKKRAEVMEIKIIDGRNIFTLKENLKQWLNR